MLFIYLVGLFDNCDDISAGSPALNAPRQLMVLGTYQTLISQFSWKRKSWLTPLKPMHLRPISLISSALYTACDFSFAVELARSKRMFNDSAEFMVIVAAVWLDQFSSETKFLKHLQITKAMQ